MRRRSLDMVAEEQPPDLQASDLTSGDRGLTPSLRVPRHRNRSRSLDNSLETNSSFAAFKESLKVGNQHQRKQSIGERILLSFLTGRHL